MPLTNFTYKSYKTYGWQVTTGTDEEKEQAIFITSFLDIYENSFNNENISIYLKIGKCFFRWWKIGKYKYKRDNKK